MNYDHNEHHWNRYKKFISSRQPSSGYTEKHHIYPRSMFPELENSKSNIIPLTAREHFIAHWMLHKAFGGAMTQAFMCMKVTPSKEPRYWKMTSVVYENVRKECSVFLSEQKTGKPLSIETRIKMSLSRIGKPLSESHRKAIGNGNRGKTFLEETKQKISAAKKGITPNRIITESYRALMKRPKQRKECPHCLKMIAVNAFTRWHGDNCKHRSENVVY